MSQLSKTISHSEDGVRALVIDPIILPSGKIAVDTGSIVYVTSAPGLYWLRKRGELLYTFRKMTELFKHVILDRPIVDRDFT